MYRHSQDSFRYPGQRAVTALTVIGGVLALGMGCGMLKQASYAAKHPESAFAFAGTAADAKAREEALAKMTGFIKQKTASAFMTVTHMLTPPRPRSDAMWTIYKPLPVRVQPFLGDLRACPGDRWVGQTAGDMACADTHRVVEDAPRVITPWNGPNALTVAEANVQVRAVMEALHPKPVVAAKPAPAPEAPEVLPWQTEEKLPWQTSGWQPDVVVTR